MCATTESERFHSQLSQSDVMWLQREARSHYNCSIASGLELEYEGGGGSRFSHWEMRLVEVISVHREPCKDNFLIVHSCPLNCPSMIKCNSA